jgi:RHS repeat-associated protein
VAGADTTYYLGPHCEIENGQTVKYIFAGDSRVAMIKGGETYYFHKDHLSSSTLMTRPDGTVYQRTDYLPYGGTKGSDDITVTDYKFTDQEQDSEIGLYNYDARLYDPVIGRFISADSIVPDLFDPQSLDRYAYCRNNPIIYNDPSGHRLQVGAHAVFPKAFYINNHTCIVITLDTPDLVNAFGNHPNFQRTNSQDQQYATMGAGPLDGKLKSKFNRPADLDLNEKREMVDINLKGRNEIDAINDLFQSDANYDDMLNYRAFPDGITSFNSNSYTSGLLEANNF